MTKRENIIRVIRRTGGTHIPLSFHLSPALLDEFKKRHGSADYEDFYGFDERLINITPSRNKPDTRKYYEGRSLKPGTVFTDIGVAHEPGSVAHFTHIVSPLAGDATTLEDVETYPLDDFDEPYRFEQVSGQVKELHERGLAVKALVGKVFEWGWHIRGMEDLMTDFYTDPEKVHALLERLTCRNERVAARLAADGVDIIMLGDDVGSQTGMMMSPESWREFLKPRLARQIRAVKQVNPEALVWYHSDGVIDPIIPELIEIGVDVLNPVQPECMDPAALKKEYGDRLSFWGTIGTQTVLPFGTPDEVRDAVRRMIEQVGAGGGLVLAPSHLLEPEVSWENIQALVDACRDYGSLI
jgi:uroporphyrinogen decarboxylase